MNLTTFTGKSIYLQNIKPEDIDIVDIAHALSNICRFGGHAKTFYSVAQHSLRVASIVPDTYKLGALLHDATEAYVGDMVRPLKILLEEYHEYENKVAYAIARAFDLLRPAFCIHEADHFMLYVEYRELMGNPNISYSSKTLLQKQIAAINTTPIPPADKAKELFLQAFAKYKEI